MGMKRLYSTMLVAGLGLSAAAQTARMQIIHNSPDAIVAAVDVYVNGALLPEGDNLTFRHATPFLTLDIANSSTVSIGIAPQNSASVTDTFFNYTVVLTPNTTYLAVVQGILSPSGYNPAPPFTIALNDMGREAASLAGRTDVMIVHSSTDAPMVDARSRITTLADNLTYGDFNSDYVSLPTLDYKIRLTSPTGGNTVATYSAPFATAGYQNQALVVLASGFLNPANNANGPALGLWAALSGGGALIQLPQTNNEKLARLQLIHNSPDIAADTADIYLVGIVDSTKIEDMRFRTATAFLDMPAGIPIRVSLAPANSLSVNDTVLSRTLVLDSAKTYIAIGNGTLTPTIYNPQQPFSINVFEGAQEQSMMPGNTDLLVVHGSTDAPTVDLRSGINLLVDNLSYDEFASSYLSVPTTDFKLRLTTANGANTIATYQAPLATYGYQGQALTIVASGFVDPAVNYNGPAFGLWAATANGGDLIQLPGATPEKLARVQVIHNSADLNADSVDVYLNDMMALDGFAFRTATPFMDLPADTALTLGVALNNSASVMDTLYSLQVTLDSGKVYSVVANGTLTAIGYTPYKPFMLSVFEGAREASANANTVDVLVMHGATDAPIVDVRSGGNVLVNDLAYGSFAPYVSLPVADYVLSVTNASGTNTFQAYQAPLQTLGLGGNAVTVLASGFFAPSANSNGADFGLWVASAAGGGLIPLPVATNVAGVANAAQEWSLAPNPTADMLWVVGLKAATAATVFDMSGRAVAQGTVSAGRGLDVAALPAGVYMLQMTVADQPTRLRFVKQ